MKDDVWASDEVNLEPEGQKKGLKNCPYSQVLLVPSGPYSSQTQQQLMAREGGDLLGHRSRNTRLSSSQHRTEPGAWKQSERTVPVPVPPGKRLPDYRD